jgi:phosphoribosylanthranilate isomerase
MSLIVKICGLKTPEALDVALESGADMVGFVFFPPSPRHLAYETARALGERVKGRAGKVALTVDADDETFAALIEALKPDLLQLHGTEPPERVAMVRARFRLPVMKALPIAERASISTRKWPIVFCSTRARRKTRRGRVDWARRSIGRCSRVSIREFRSCCRAVSMPAMSQKPCASRARAASMCRPAWSARPAKRIPTK